MVPEKEVGEHFNYPIVAKAPFPVLVLSGSNLTVSYVNPAAAGLGGFPGSAIGAPLKQVAPKLFSDEEIETIIETCLIRGGSLKLPERQLGNSSSPLKSFSVICERLDDQEDHHRSIICYFTEVPARTEQELLRLNAQLQEAQKLARLGSWEWNVSSGQITWSKEMYHVYGYEHEFTVDFQKATELMSPQEVEESRRRTEEHIQKAQLNFKSTGERVWEIDSVEFFIRAAGGQRKKLRSSGKVYLTEEGKLDRILGAVQDVTDIRFAEEQLRQLNNELQSKNNELESFNYVVSHDLKEPLRKIQTFIGRIETAQPAELSGYLAKVDAAASRMRELIESILALSRVSSSEFDLSSVDLNTVLENCKSDLEVTIKDRDVVILSDHLPVVRANQWQFHQVFLNMLSNSIKFCEGRPQIKIQCKKASRMFDKELINCWCISFEDNGIGFDMRHKDRIFKPFERLHAKSAFGGTGVGLSIVKRIIERHHGAIDVQSEPGKGTTFIIWLPVLHQN